MLETYPEKSYFIYQQKIYSRIKNGLDQTPSGHADLYELNLKRTGTESNNDLVYPFILKDTTRGSFRTITKSQYDSFNFGQEIKDEYPMTASLMRTFVPSGNPFSLFTFDQLHGVESIPAASHANKKYIVALEHLLYEYETLSRHFSYKYDVGSETWNKGTQAINLITIPSILYGSSIKKGSVKLRYYRSGDLVAELHDKYGNGELVQTTGSTGLGEVGGVVMYNHGFALLTGSWSLHAETEQFESGVNSNPKWLTFGAGLPSMGSTPQPGSMENSSFEVEFKGVSKIPTVTMFARARKNEFNYSSNPTSISHTNQPVRKLSNRLYKAENGKVKNIVKSPFKDHEEKFDNETYISKIGIYDEHYNLLGIATLATPTRKTNKRDLTFKLKLDI